MTTFKTICRTCAKDEKPALLKSIFSTDRKFGLSVAELIVTCSNTEIAENDGLPQGICVECEKSLQAAFSFRQKIEDTFRELIILQEKMLVGGDETKEELFQENDHTNIVLEDIEEEEEDLEYDTQPEPILIVPKNEDETIEEPQNEVVVMNIEPDSKEEFEVLEVACNQQGIRYKCSVCDKTFGRQAHVKRHQLTHTSIKPFSCGTCGKSFARNDHLSKHILTHSDSKPYECDFEQCTKRFSREINLRMHKKCHEVPSYKRKIYSCDKCGNSFTTARYLEIHLANHEEKKMLACKFCPEQFESRNDLIKHSHQHDKPYLCTICGQRFLRKDYLRVHVRRHTGEKPFKCRFCDKSFPRTTDLSIHERYHTNEKTHLCNICGKGFARSYNLIIHNRTHTGEKPFQCPHCVKTFAQSQDLKAHVRRHTGELIRCDICDDGFVQNYLLAKHKRQVHKLEVEKKSRRLQKFIPQPPDKLLENLETAELQLQQRLNDLKRDLEVPGGNCELILEQINLTEREITDVLDQRSLILSHIETEGIISHDNVVIVNIDPGSRIESTET